MADSCSSQGSRLEQSLMRCPAGSTSPGRNDWVLLGRGEYKRTRGARRRNVQDIFDIASSVEHHSESSALRSGFVRRIDKRRTEVIR